MIGHLSQARELRPSALGHGGRKGRRKKVSDIDIVDNFLAGSRAMLQDFMLLQTLILTFTGYFLPNQLLF